MAIIDVIKYDGTPNIFAWKYPSDELGTWTQLIVNESQEAVLFIEGKALDVFSPGRHVLDTANIPILSALMKLPFGGKTPFTAEVWYVNRVYSLSIKWGTPSPIQLLDPKFKILVPVRAFGQFGIQIEDSRKFLTRLVGTLHTFDSENVIQYFRGLYLTKVRDAIASYLVHKSISIMEINAHISDLSDFVCESMQSVLAEYGVRLLNFYINDINTPEQDPAVRKLKEALSKRAEMEIVGYNYVQERSFNTMDEAASRTGAGVNELMGAGISLGIGTVMGNSLGAQYSEITQTLSTAENGVCPACKARIIDKSRFCGTCGMDTQAQGTDTAIVCHECQTTNPLNAKYCSGCGKRQHLCSKCKKDNPSEATICTVCSTSMPPRCPACGLASANRAAKFCIDCGHSLQATCPSCSTTLPPSTKFCPECGTKTAY